MAATTEVEVKVHSYRNPSSRCDECRSPDNLDPRCCDETSLRPLGDVCPVTCDTAMGVCVRPLGSTGITCLQMSLGLVFFQQTNSLDFADDFFRFTNPWILQSNGVWRVSDR